MRDKELLFHFANEIFRRRMFVLKIVGVFIVLGLFISFDSPFYYQTSSKILPDSNKDNLFSSSSLLGSIGGLGNLNGMMGSGSKVLDPKIYTMLLESRSCHKVLMHQKVNFSEFETELSIFEYYQNHYNQSISETIFSWFPSVYLWLKKVVFQSGEIANPNLKSNYFMLSKEEVEVSDKLLNVISSSLDEVTGVLTIATEFHDPEAVVDLNKIIVDYLEKYTDEIHQEKLIRELQYLESQYQIYEERYNASQKRLAYLVDANRNVIKESSKIIEESARNDMKINFELFLAFKKQLEQKKVALSENSKSFSIIAEPLYPFERSKPRRAIIMIVFVFSGLSVSIFLLILNDLIKNIKEEFYKIDE